MPDPAVDYFMRPALAEALRPIALLPRRARIDALLDYAREHGSPILLEAFADFIGLANSVAANCREMAELVLVTTGQMHPHTAEQVNLPTVEGALIGVTLAARIHEGKTCSGCAFRLGTAANQSPITTLDASDCIQPGASDFYCHDDLDERGQPTKACAGWAQLRARAKREPDHV